MNAPPLTHHEILSISAPFTRRGRHVDLGATDRSARRIDFKALSHARPNGEQLEERLVLTSLKPGYWHLVRRVEDLSGLEATVEAEGADPAVLLDRIERVPLETGLRAGDGYVLAEHYRHEPGPGEDRLVLTAATGRVHGLTLELTMPLVRGYPADISLSTVAKAGLPADLLAVLGRDWRVLEERVSGWAGTMRVPRREPRRTSRARAKLEEALLHLAGILAEPPARFNERFRVARWGVALRRALPLILCIALLFGVAALPILEIERDSAFQLLLFNLPTILMVAFFSRREIPKIELPPLPRRSNAGSWQPGAQ